MNKNVLAKVLGMVMAVCLVEKAGAWPHLHLPGFIKQGASEVANEGASMAEAAVVAGLSGQDPKAAAKNQFKNDASNAVGLNGGSGGSDTGGNESGGEDNSDSESDGDVKDSGNNFEPDSDTDEFGGSE